MTTYCELLTREMDDPATSDRVAGNLIEYVATKGQACRQHRLASPFDVSWQLDYDHALIMLSRAMGIDTGPAHFFAPGTERARLQLELTDRGPTWSALIHFDERPAASLPVYVHLN
jgi:hypothetical protein